MDPPEDSASVCMEYWPDLQRVSGLAIACKHRGAEDRFERQMGVYSLAGGRAVFNTDSSTRDRLVRMNCMMVIGVDVDGQQTSLYSHWPECTEPQARWFDRPIRRAVSRLTRQASMSGPNDPVGPAQAPRLAALATAMCNANDVFSVYIAQHIQVLHKPTGTMQSRKRVLHYRECQSGASTPDAWPTIAEDEHGALTLSWASQ